MLGTKPIADITAPQLLAMAKKIESRGALDIAKRSLQTCGQIMRYAVAHGDHRTQRCCRREARRCAEASQEDELSRGSTPRNCPTLLRKMDAYDGSPYTRFAMHLIALTFVRTSELIEAPWDEFDLEAAEWRIPAARMKMGTPHIVPLASQAVELLASLHELRGLSGVAVSRANAITRSR